MLSIFSLMIEELIPASSCYVKPQLMLVCLSDSQYYISKLKHSHVRTNHMSSTLWLSGMEMVFIAENNSLESPRTMEQILSLTFIHIILSGSCMKIIYILLIYLIRVHESIRCFNYLKKKKKTANHCGTFI